jgi:hypothetical protein
MADQQTISSISGQYSVDENENRIYYNDVKFSTFTNGKTKAFNRKTGRQTDEYAVYIQLSGLNKSTVVSEDFKKKVMDSNDPIAMIDKMLTELG